VLNKLLPIAVELLALGTQGLVPCARTTVFTLDVVAGVAVRVVVVHVLLSRVPCRSGWHASYLQFETVC
jgi:hypothetical protein